MASGYNVLLTANVNTKPADAELQKFISSADKRYSANLKINVDTKSLQTATNELKKIKTNLDDSTLAKYNTTLNNVAKNYKSVSVNAKDFGNTTETIKGKLDELNPKFTLTNEQLRKMAVTMEGIDIPVKKTSESISKWKDSNGHIITQTRTFDNELGALITKVEKYQNSLGQTVTKTTTFNDWMEKISENTKIVDDRVAQEEARLKALAKAEQEAAKKGEQVSETTQQMGSSMQKASTHATTLGEKIVIAAGKVALFKVSTTIVMAFYDAIGAAKNAIMDFDAALTEFKKVSDLSGDALADYTEKLGELGEAVARSRTQMVEAATEFRKSGFSDEQSAQLAQIASLYQNVADSELSAGDSASYIISQMKAFGMTTTEEAQSIIDKTNEVSNNFAVSSTAISQALTKTSSAMAAYGNTVDETIALTASGAEILNGNVGKVAKGLRSIGANITNLAAASDTMQISVNGSLETIQLIDKTTGDMLSTYDVLAQISQYWDDMNSSEQSTLALTLANKTQFEVFTSVLSNFDTAERALTTSLTSQGSAWKENEAFLQSNEASINSIKASFSELILDSHLDEFVKLVLQATAGLMKFANSGLGKVIISMGLATATTTAFIYAIEKENSGIVKLLLNVVKWVDGIKAVSLAEVVATAETKGLAVALQMLNINPVVLAVTALVGAITAFTVVSKSAKDRLEELDSEIQTLKSESEQATSTISELKDQLDKLNEKKLTLTDKDQLAQLEAESAELENQLRLQYDLIEANKNKIKQDYQEKISSGNNEYTRHTVKQDSLYGYKFPSRINEGTAAVSEFKTVETTTSTATGDLNKKLKDQSADVDALTLKLEEAIARKKELNITESQYQGYLETGNGLTKQEAQEYENVNQSITNLSDSLRSAKDDYSETIEYMKGAQEAGVELSEETEQIINGYDEQIAKSQDATMSLEEIADKYGVSVQAITEYMAANEDCESATEAAVAVLESQADAQETVDESLQNLSSDLKSLATDYQSLQSAVEDYNNGGTMSLETLDALINAATNYSGCLELQNGKLVLNEKYFETLAQQKIANAKADLVMETQTKLATLAEQTQGEVISQTSGVIDTSKASVDDICVSLQNMTGDAITAAQAWNVLKSSMSSEDAGNLEYQQKINEIRDEFTVQWKTLDEIGSQISGNFDGYASSIANSSSSAASSSKDAWLEAYKAEKDALDAMYENGTYTAEQYQEKLLELGNKYLLDSKEHQEEYADEIKDLYEDVYEALKEAAKDALDEMKDAHKEAEEALKKANETAEKNLKKQHEAQEEAIEAQIDALERQKDAVKDSYDAQIEALKREREEYENQLELMKLKEELAEAQQTYQYVMGEDGRFTWTQDQAAVEEAQEELYEEELKQTYERQLQDLEDARDRAEELYEQQIQDLEDYLDKLKDENDAIEEALEESHDAQEEALEAHNDQIEELYEKAISDYNTYAEMLENGQLSQIASENANWATRLSNLASFVNNYNAMLAKLGDEGTTVSSSYSGSSGSKSYTSSNSGNNSNGSKSSGSKTSTNNSTTTLGLMYQMGLIATHASGADVISNDELALVGDSPNQELVIGSKLNGVPMSLSKGTGVVNAKSTRTLAGLLNSFGAGQTNYTTTNSNNQASIQIGTINLPEVKNGNDFVKYLQNFNVDMTTMAYGYR